MEKLSVYDAKARFSKVIELAESGRATAITKRGHEYQLRKRGLLSSQ